MRKCTQKHTLGGGESTRSVRAHAWQEHTHALWHFCRGRVDATWCFVLCRGCSVTVGSVAIILSASNQRSSLGAWPGGVQAWWCWFWRGPVRTVWFPLTKWCHFLGQWPFFLLGKPVTSQLLATLLRCHPFRFLIVTSLLQASAVLFCGGSLGPFI